MKYYIIVIFLLSTIFSCSPKLQQSASTYNNSKEFFHTYDEFISPKETKVATWYHYVKTVHESGYYIMRYFYPETKQMTYLKTYKTRACMNLHGPYKSWWENGNKRSEGVYQNDKREETWTFYGWKTGTKESVGDYLKDNKTGNWKFYDKKERLKEERMYVEGLAEGNFTVYDTLGRVFKKGVYKADTIFSEELMVEMEEGTETHLADEYVVIEQMPEYPGGESKMLEYLYSNINYPIKAREYSVEGLCVVSFVVELDGSISNVESRIGLCEPMEKECIRIVKSLDNWEPGYQDGKPVRVTYNLPIRFKLQ